MQSLDQRTMCQSLNVDLTVYPARRIRTMNGPPPGPDTPTPDLVVVADGMIVEVGTRATVQPWLDAHPHTIDDTFADKVLMPGLIDPHLHPSLGATLLPTHFITAMQWDLPDGTTAPATRSHEDYLAELRRIHGSLPDPDEVLVTWGHHELWHGTIQRQVLDQISARRPIVVWQRSFHEIHMNTAAMAHFGLDHTKYAAHPQIDQATGRFAENGMSVALGAMGSYLSSPERFHHGLELTRDAVHQGGQTTIGDLIGSQWDSDEEWDALYAVLDNDAVPFRTQMIPNGIRALTSGTGRDDPAAWLATRAERGTDKLLFRNHVKLFTDGGFYAQLMQVNPPGFIDGHHGEWMSPPEKFEELARAYWHAGCQIHVHCTGDMGVELALDVLAKLQWERPRFDHRFTIEHMGLSNPEQIRRARQLGALASVNIYYLHELGEAYWMHSVGHERASQMARVGTCIREGVPTALHSDFTMAPAKPLTSAWVAVNRLSESGDVLGPEERISVHEALRAITIDAAYVLGMEDEIGTIRAGKKADFVVLEQDPYEIDPLDLANIDIWGTVFEGTPFPIQPSPLHAS